MLTKKRGNLDLTNILVVVLFVFIFVGAYFTDEDGVTGFAGRTKAACEDKVDNDGDNFVDWNGRGIEQPDPGCDSKQDNSERSSSLVCDDGVDNDGDGKVDYPADLGCISPSDSSEVDPLICGDGIITNPEVCDGSNLGGKTCANSGYSGGTLSCASDCKSFITTGCYTNSCSDSDGGIKYPTLGTVTGSSNGNSFSYTDSCASVILTEWYCGGTNPLSTTFNCAGNNTN